MDQVERFSQAYSQTPWRTQMQILGVFTLTLVFAGLVAGIYLNLSARKTATGRAIQNMVYKTWQTRNENAALSAELARLTSAEVMAERAERLGFEAIEQDQVVFLRVEGYRPRQAANLAVKRAPELPGAPVLPPEYTESLFDWLGRQFLRYQAGGGGR